MPKKSIFAMFFASSCRIRGVITCATFGVRYNTLPPPGIVGLR